MIKKFIDRLLGKGTPEDRAPAQPPIPVVPLGARVEVPQAEHRIDAGLLDHLAGLAVRSELLRRIIEASERGGETRLPTRPPWSNLVSVVPELERDLARLMRSLDAPPGLTARRCGQARGAAAAVPRTTGSIAVRTTSGSFSGRSRSRSS